MVRVDMTLSDNAILEAIIRQTATKGDFTFAEIAVMVGCSTRTVDRAVSRLRSAGKLTIVSSPGRNRSWADLRRHDPNA